MSLLRRSSLLVLVLVAVAALPASGAAGAKRPHDVGQTSSLRLEERIRRGSVDDRLDPRHADDQPSPTMGERAIRIALRAVGTPYRYGGESPSSGFDCSGLVRWSYGRLGVDLPHSSYALAREGRAVVPGRARPGDVLLFAGLGHVGLYLGAGRMVHAPQSGRRVEVVRLGRAGYRGLIVGARRVVPA